MSRRRRRRQEGAARFAASETVVAPAPPITPDMMRMLATPANDITIPNYGNVLRSQDDTILQKGGARGVRLYDEVRRDGHALSVLNKRISKVISREWVVVPASDRPIDVQAADLVRRQLKAMSFDRITASLLEAVLYGYSVAEIEWAVKDSETFPRRIVPHQRSRFVFGHDGRPRLLTLGNMMDGEELPDRKFIVHRHDPEGSDPYGRGLGRVLFWHVLFKREGVGFWAHFLEKYASPTPYAKYPMGTPPAEQDRLLQHLVSLVQNGALVLPLGSEAGFLEAARTGAATYEEWCRYWDEQTSIVVLGETLSTTLKGAGSRAASETHNEVSNGIADSDGDMASGSYNDQLVRWIVEFNLPGAEPPTVWWPRPKNEQAEDEQREQRAKRQKSEVDNLFDLAAKGFRPADGIEAALSDITGVDIIADPSLIHHPQTLPTGRETITREALGSTALTPAFVAHDDHGLGDLTSQLAGFAQPEIDGWITKVLDAVSETVDAGGDRDALRQRILAAYRDLDVTPLGAIMGAAFALADLSGRADIIDETGERP